MNQHLKTTPTTCKSYLILISSSWGFELLFTFRKSFASHWTLSSLDDVATWIVVSQVHDDQMSCRQVNHLHVSKIQLWCFIDDPWPWRSCLLKHLTWLNLLAKLEPESCQDSKGSACSKQVVKGRFCSDLYAEFRSLDGLDQALLSGLTSHCSRSIKMTGSLCSSSGGCWIQYNLSPPPVCVHLVLRYESDLVLLCEGVNCHRVPINLL